MPDYRLFIAIPLPSSVTQALASLQAQLQTARPVRWTKPAQIHLTLQFLGDVPTTKIDGLIMALQKTVSPQSAFRLTVETIGVFPNLKRPRVIWAGISGETERLQQLHAAVIGATQQLGFTPETRPFKAHLTLGRTDKRATGRDYAHISRIIAQQQEQIGHIAPLPVSYISLIRSQLKPTGPIYTPLADIPLMSS